MNIEILDKPPRHKGTNGQLPDGWRWVRLGDVCERIDYGFTASADFAITEPCLLRITDIQNGRVDWKTVPGCRISPSEEDINRLADGDIVIARTGGTTGKSFLIRQPPRAVFASYLIRLRPTDAVAAEYVYAFLRSDEYWQQIRTSVRGGAQPNVNAKLLGAITLSLPPLAEQKRIAAILNKQMEAVERARIATKAQLDAAKVLPAAYLRAVFNSPEAQEWQRKTLGDVCRDISDGTHFTPTYVPEGIPFLSVKDVRETGLSFSNCRFITEEQHRELCKRCKPERGDVLYTKVGTTGIAKAIDLEREFSIFVSVALLKLGSDVLPEYMEKVLNAPICRVQAENLTQGAANRNLVLQDLKRIEIPLPTLAKQQRIVAALDEKMNTVEQLRQSLEEELDAIKKLSAALLRRAFNGEL